MDVNEMQQAIEGARLQIRRADNVVASMANLCAGRLKIANVSPSILIELKKELKDFNMHTGRWKNE